MRPERLLDPVPGHRRCAWDMGSGGSQTTFNSGRAVLDAANDVRGQLLEAAVGEAGGSRRRPRARRGRRSREGLARQLGDRSPRSRIGRHHLRQGRGRRCPTRRPSTPVGCVGRLGNESFLAPQLFTHAAHVKVDRRTGVVRVLRVAAVHDSGRILNQHRGRRAGLRRRRHGHRSGAHGGHAARRGRPSAQPAPARLQAGDAPDAPRIDVEWIEIDTPNAGPKGSKGVGEPPCVPTAGAVANAISKVIGRQVATLPMTPERVWVGGHRRSGGVSTSYVAPTSLDDAFAALAAGARPVAGGTDLVVGSRQGKAPLPDTSSRSIASRTARDRAESAGGAEDRRARRPTKRSWPTRSFEPVSRPWRTPRRSWVPMRHGPRARSEAT